MYHHCLPDVPAPVGVGAAAGMPSSACVNSETWIATSGSGAACAAAGAAGSTAADMDVAPMATATSVAMTTSASRFDFMKLFRT